MKKKTQQETPHPPPPLGVLFGVSPEGLVCKGGLDDVLAVIKGARDTDAVDVAVGNSGHLPLLDLAHPAFREHDETVHVLFAAQAVDGGRACHFAISSCFIATTKCIRNVKQKQI